MPLLCMAVPITALARRPSCKITRTIRGGEVHFAASFSTQTALHRAERTLPAGYCFCRPPCLTLKVEGRR